jgi:hypothetical protein
VAVLLRVDILNIMGLAIHRGRDRLGGLPRTRGRRADRAGPQRSAHRLGTPIVRAAGWLAALPDPIEGYIRPVQGISSFILFPWAGFVFAGRRPGWRSTPCGTRASARSIAGSSYGPRAGGRGLRASYLPSPYPRTFFWTTSPAYFFLRAGIILMVVGAAYAWSVRPGGEPEVEPRPPTGRHVAVHLLDPHRNGLRAHVGTRSTRRFRSRRALLLLALMALFALFMLACSVAKTRAVGPLAVRIAAA